MRLLFSLTAATAMMLTLAGCGDPNPVYVDGGYVRLNANPAAPSAAYFTLHGGDDAVVLRDITTEAAVRLEMHESMMQDGMASMKSVNTIDVPANGTVKLAPGGTHVMLWQVNPQAVATGKISFTFIFSNGDRILVDAIVQKADGTPAGQADEHAAH